VRIEPIMSIRGVFAIGCQLPLRSCALLAATSRIRHEAKGGLTTTSTWEHFSSPPLRSLPLAALAWVRRGNLGSFWLFSWHRPHRSAVRE